MVPLALLIAVVDLDVRDCAGADAAEVVRIVRIELEERVQTSSTALAVRCAGNTALLAATSPHGRAGRDLRLDDVDKRARARLIALALGELLDDPALLRPARVDTPREVHHEPRAVEALTQVGAGVGATVFADPSSVGFGAEVFGAYGVDRLVIRSGIAAGYATRSLALGSVRMIAVSASAELAARIPLAPGRVNLDVGAGARLGYTNLSGSARSDDIAASSTVDGLFFGPIVDVAVFLPVSAAIDVGFRAEAGVALTGVVGASDGAAQIGVDGLWLRTTFVVAYGR